LHILLSLSRNIKPILGATCLQPRRSGSDKLNFIFIFQQLFCDCTSEFLDNHQELVSFFIEAVSKSIFNLRNSDVKKNHKQFFIEY
jgi:hypothetical protein